MIRLSDQATSIFDEGRAALEPSDAQRKRVRAKLAGRLAGLVAATATATSAHTALAASAASGTAAGTSTLWIATKVVIALVGAAGTVGGGVLAYRAIEKPELEAVDVATRPQPAAPSVVRLPSVEDAAPVVVQLPVESAPTPASVRPARRARRRAIEATDDGPSEDEEIEGGTIGVPQQAELQTVPGDLAGETRLLDRVQSALNDGAAARALKLLERYAADFPSGQLVEEATTLRKEAQRSLKDGVTDSDPSLE